jgi:hypothetical protein
MEMIVTYVKVASWHSPGGNEVNHNRTSVMIFNVLSEIKSKYTVNSLQKSYSFSQLVWSK